ncbi:part of 3prime5prime exonuclease/helicase (Wrn) [Blumeria hordei DH14]|uniref:Part of 3prime5prime exonuclease/helicase (Wrn) n=1 Tax=Blumeria graminis f. sp. hordei (strain DH14) TaxID=546991 RepID=N1J6A3_BLUG1|nr:part of 3prime5prime exonuclease/helicase (Wrn) [Blumeria hordei DH14]
MLLTRRRIWMQQESGWSWNKVGFKGISSHSPPTAAGAFFATSPQVRKFINSNSVFQKRQPIQQGNRPSNNSSSHYIKPVYKTERNVSSQCEFLSRRKVRGNINNFKNLANYHSAIESVTTLDEMEDPEDSTQNELPLSDSSFKITEELFRAAKNAEPETPASFWSYRLYRGPPVGGVPSRPIVHYCQSSETAERVLHTYFLDQKVVGFDIEWKVDAMKFHGPRANVSLIQIASEERIALLHLALYPKNDILVPPSLRKLLVNPNISKVGVAIKSDCTRIKNHLNVDAQGIFELSHLFRLVKFFQTENQNLINRKLVSLAKQVQEHLHLPLSKNVDIRSSDWSSKLDTPQIVYAAADSYAALQLYNTMEIKRKALKPTPPRPYHAELNFPIRLSENSKEDLKPDEELIHSPRLEVYVKESILAHEDGSEKLQRTSNPSSKGKRVMKSKRTEESPLSEVESHEFRVKDLKLNNKLKTIRFIQQANGSFAHPPAAWN